ncbi:MAG: hypothetical protein V1734_06145 [Nanoarchaeota archaeon]
MTIERIFGNCLCSSTESIDRHLEKHLHDWDREKYVAIGESISNGEQGEHMDRVDEAGVRGWYRAIVKGEFDRNGKVYGILRTIYEVGDDD